MKITELKTKDEMLRVFDLIKELYPDMTVEEYSEQLELMIPHNYSMISVNERNKNVGLAGLWIGNKLWCGKYLEIDHIVVSKEWRSKRVGAMIIDYAKTLAKTRGCKSLGLDSFTHNHDSHRFFYREGFIAKGFHFVYEFNGLD